METQEVVAFFQTFNFDTLLASISCIAGVVALFLGGSALSNYNKIKNSFNDKKEFKDNSIDQSQKAGGNIINQTSDVTALTTLKSANFAECLHQAYEYFDQKSSENLHKIIDEANRLVQENRITLAKYTKTDWISIYFESAKNASDTYMQNIWAKVLAKELETPDSFSFKTLDVLKNMSSDDFKLFERLCSMQVNGYILGHSFTDPYIPWVDVLNLSEWGLINLNLSDQVYDIEANSYKNLLICENRFIIYFKNEGDKTTTVDYSIYFLTKAANELLRVANFSYQREFIVNFVREIKDRCKAQVVTELHDVDWVKGQKVSYNLIDLLSDKNV